MCCCTHRGRLSATWRWASQPSGRHPSTMPASPPLRWVQRDMQNIWHPVLKSYLVCLLCDCYSWVTVIAPEVGRQPLVCKGRAGYSVPGSFGLHLPLLICCGEWLTQWDWGKKGEENTCCFFMILYNELINTLPLGPVSQRRYWRQSEPSLRPLFRPVRLCCGGEFTSHGCFQRPVVTLVYWTLRAVAGVCLRHRDRMAPLLQHLPVLQPVGAERPVAVSRVALCGGCHGKLVRKVRVCSPFHLLANINSWLTFWIYFVCLQLWTAYTHTELQPFWHREAV